MLGDMYKRQAREVVAPGDRVQQCLVPFHPPSPCTSKEAEPVVEPCADVLDRQCVRARCCQLDRQRQPVEPLHDLSYNRGLRVEETGPGRGCAEREETHALLRRQRGEREDPLAPDSEPFTARCQDDETGTADDEGPDEMGDLIEQVEGVAVHSPKQMAQQVGRFGAGAVVRVQFLRKGTPLTVMPRLEPYPSNEQLLRLQWLGRPAPALQGLLATDGSPGPILDSFRGKVLVLDFWASFCIACRVSTVSMNGWHQRYAGQGLEIVGIAAEPPEVVEQASRRFAMRYQAYADPDMTTTASYRVQELPSVVIIDRKGIIRDVATGYAPERMHQLETLIQRLLREPNP